MAPSAEPAVPAAPHVAYLVRSWPRLTQTYVLDEVLGLERLGLRLHIFALVRPDETLVQPEVRSVRAPVSYLDGRRGWRAATDHLQVALATPARSLGAGGGENAMQQPGTTIRRQSAGCRADDRPEVGELVAAQEDPSDPVDTVLVRDPRLPGTAHEGAGDASQGGREQDHPVDLDEP